MNGETPTILVADDKPNMLRLVTKIMCQTARVVSVVSGKDAISALETEHVDVVLCDLRMPDLTGLEVLAATRTRQPRARFVLMTAYATVETAVTALKNGAFDYITKPFEPEEARAVLLRALHSVRPICLEEDQVLPGVHARSPLMHELAAVVRQVAPTNIRTLITGEVGVGKTRVARALHRLSHLREERFVSIDLPTMTSSRTPEALQRTLDQIARDYNQPGVIFLKDIHKLLPQEQSLLAATLARLERTRASGGDGGTRLVVSSLREDALAPGLLQQVRVASIGVPALRCRREDIPLLAAHLLAELDGQGRGPQTFSASALERLSALDWPRNIKELREVVEHAVALAGGGQITLESLPRWVDLESEKVCTETLTWAAAMTLGRAQVARGYLVAALERFGGDVVAASEFADVERESFYRLLRRYGIHADAYRGSHRDTDGDT